MTTEIVYPGRDNVHKRYLKSNDAAVDISGATSFELRFNGTTYDSDTYSDYFDWTTEGTLGILSLTLGMILAGVDEGTRDYGSELIYYDSEYTNGIVWGSIDIWVKDVDA